MIPLPRAILILVFLLAWPPLLQAQDAPRWGSGVGLAELAMPEGEADGLGLLSVAATYNLTRHLEIRGSVYSGLNSRVSDAGPRIRAEQGIALRLMASVRLDRGRLYAGVGPGWTEASALVADGRRYRSRSGTGWVAGAAWRPGQRTWVGLEYQQFIDRGALSMDAWMLQFRYRGD